MIVEIETEGDIERWQSELLENTTAAINALRSLDGDPLEALARVKFEPIGRHPLENRPLNLIEQVNWVQKT